MCTFWVQVAAECVDVNHTVLHWGPFCQNKTWVPRERVSTPVDMCHDYWNLRAYDSAVLGTYSCSQFPSEIWDESRTIKCVASIACYWTSSDFCLQTSIAAAARSIWCHLLLDSHNTQWQAPVFIAKWRVSSRGLSYTNVRRMPVFSINKCAGLISSAAEGILGYLSKLNELPWQWWPFCASCASCVYS